MKKLRLRFGLRTLIAALMVAALLLAMWGQSLRYQKLAAFHHIVALNAGYQAADMLRETDRELAWSSIKDGELPIKWDDTTLRFAAPVWRDCISHSRMRDQYLHAMRRPWLIVRVEPPRPASAYPAPMSSQAFQQVFQSFLEANEYFFNVPMSFDVQRDATVLELNRLLLSEDDSRDVARRHPFGKKAE
jgi:hypothetical protein